VADDVDGRQPQVFKQLADVQLRVMKQQQQQEDARSAISKCNEA
jgi:hypothetical protein